MKDELRRTSEHFNKVSEMSHMGEKEAEMRYKARLMEVKEDHQMRQEEIEREEERKIREKEGEIKRFMEESNKYFKDKK